MLGLMAATVCGSAAAFARGGGCGSGTYLPNALEERMDQQSLRGQAGIDRYYDNFALRSDEYQTITAADRALQQAQQALTADAAGGETTPGKELLPYYPPNGGFLGQPEAETLDVGIHIDRYGSSYGKYASPAGTPYPQRSLPPGSETKPYSVYEVLKPLRVKAGPAAPAFGEFGGGTQYLLPRSVQALIDEGFLKEVSP